MNKQDKELYDVFVADGLIKPRKPRTKCANCMQYVKNSTVCGCTRSPFAGAGGVFSSEIDPFND